MDVGSMSEDNGCIGCQAEQQLYLQNGTGT